MKWRVLLPVVLAASILPVGAAVTSAAEDTSFVFEGAGWGHGVGMSQWSAYGQALAYPDRAGEEIAAFYYPGSAPATMSDLSLPNDLLYTLDRPLWVNLGSQITLLEFTAVGGPLELCLAGDGAGPCPKPEQPQEGERWQFRRIDRKECGFFLDDELQGTPGVCSASIIWPEADGVQLRHGEGRSRICAVGSRSECEYRHGELKIRDDPVEVGFHVLLAVGLEDYLKGIAEISNAWHQPGVNEAQVVAARSYAAFKFLQYETGPRGADPSVDPGISNARKDACWCHVHDNTRDMNYIGWARESASGSGPWLAAVAETRDRVLTYSGVDYGKYTKGGIIQAFFSTSSGGVTSSNRHGFFSEWNGNPVRVAQWPYLAPIDDPWDTDPDVGNPHASWESRVAASEIARALGWETVAGAELAIGASVDTPAHVRFTGYREGDAVSATVAGAWLRIALDLKSSNITAIDGLVSDPSAFPEHDETAVDVIEDDPTLEIGNEGAGRDDTSFDLLPAFPDSAGTVHAEGIQAIRQAGITQGCGTGLRYCPEEVVTRGAMATFLLRALELEPADGDRFSDVSAGHNHRGAIYAISDLGLTRGCGDGTRFCPNDPVTRETMAVFLARALELRPSGPDGIVFSDVAADHPNSGDIYAIADRGITAGCGDGTRFCPDDPVTRGSMATLLARAFLSG